MPHRIVLSHAQCQIFEAVPATPEELARHYTLTEDDLALIKERRQARNRLGFAIQLCLTRYPGRALRVGEKLPEQLVAFIAEQTGDDPFDFTGYAERDTTRREHLLFLIRHFKLSTFSKRHFQELSAWLLPITVENPKGLFLVGAVLNELRRRCILQPPLPVIERLVATTELRAEKAVYARVNENLTDGHRAALEAWLIRSDEEAQSRLSWIRQPPGAPSPKNILLILEKLTAIRDLALPDNLFEVVPQARRQQLTREGNRVAIPNLQSFESARRYAILAVYLLETRRTLIDEAIGMHDRTVGMLLRQGKHKQTAQLQQDAKDIKRAISVFSSLGHVLMQAKESGEDPWLLIEQAIPWGDLVAAVGDAEALSQSQRFDHLSYIDTRYPQVRKYAPALLEHFDFQATSGSRDVLYAVELLRDLNQDGKRKLPSDAPTSFVPKQWEPYVQENSGLNRRYYELCVLNVLRDRLRSGDIWVPGSKRYQDFDGYLLGQPAFQELCEVGTVPVAVETDFSTYMNERSAYLRTQLDDTNTLLRQEKLDGVQIKNGRLSVSPHRGTPMPDEATYFIERVYAALPRIKITDLLAEVDRWTQFTDQFTHLRTNQPSKEKQALLTVILADGINLGLMRMAEACPGASARQLSWIADWYVRDECYARALAEVVNYHHAIPLVENWGDGTTASSDGQHFPVGSVGKALGETNVHYGTGAGVLFYTHISDQYAPFHTQLIHATAKDATYVLDGLLYHESDLEIEEHYTDTAGFTDHVFALCHLLGFRFAPRMRDIGDMRLHVPFDAKEWKYLEPLFAERIKLKEIENQWEDILRLATSIRLGTVTASLIIRKLAAYPRQNRLALATREFGRVERSIFILEWMKSPTLRGRVQVGLNKGEARNALARAVFFNRLGEIRDRSFENQCYRASGLNLVVAAIILWNTVYLEKAVGEVRKGMDVPEEYLSYLSPLGWEHINLTGDYIWDLDA